MRDGYHADDGRKVYCYVCAHPWRNLIDLEIHERKPPGTIWGHLPVTPSVPLPTIPEIKRHRSRKHMRPKDVILAEQEQKLKLLNDLIDGPGLPGGVELTHASLVASPPRIPPRPRRRETKPPARLSTRGPEAAWSDNVLHHRQWRHGWTPEAQLALRDIQGNRCWICGTENPTCFDVISKDENEQQMVYGYLCQRCKGAVSMLDHNPVLFGRAQDYLLNPPSRRMLDRPSGPVSSEP
jgi:hypothetical protein